MHHQSIYRLVYQPRKMLRKGVAKCWRGGLLSESETDDEAASVGTEAGVEGF